MQAFLLLFFFSVALASHFYTSSICWTRTSGNENTTRTYTVSVTEGYRQGSVAQPVSQFTFSPMPPDGTQVSATNTGSLVATNSGSADSSYNWDLFKGSFTVTIPAAGALKNWRYDFSSCCRISTLQDGNHDLGWHFTGVMNRFDDSSPCPVNGIPNIRVDINVPNTLILPILKYAAPVKFLFATQTESTLVVPFPSQPPGGGLVTVTNASNLPFQLNTNTGIYTWQPSINGLWVVQYMLERDCAPEGHGSVCVDSVNQVDCCSRVMADLAYVTGPAAQGANDISFVTPFTEDVDPRARVLTYTPQVQYTTNVCVDKTGATIFSSDIPSGSSFTATTAPNGQTCKVFTWPSPNTDAVVCFAAKIGDVYSRGQYCLKITDLNACVHNPCIPTANCFDLGPPAADDAAGRQCVCQPGYLGDGNTCTEINACTGNPCAGNATCADLPPPGLADNGGRTCTCNPAYTGNGYTCSDLNACTTSPCGVNANCADFPAPALGDPSGRTCTCKTGYSGDGTTCSDINACSIAGNACGVNSTCSDKPAPALSDASGRTCACNTGFSGDGMTCADINACGLVACTNPSAVCTDKPAPALGDATGRTCSCPPGTSGNGVTCTEIDACSIAGNGCGSHATCVDKPAPALADVTGRNCVCDDGFGFDNQTQACLDINACIHNACSQYAKCTDISAPALDNTQGRTCACNVGYTGDGNTCKSDDAYVCTETPNGRVCEACPTPWRSMTCTSDGQKTVKCLSNACPQGCDDGDDCTFDQCDADGCQHTPIPNCNAIINLALNKPLTVTCSGQAQCWYNIPPYQNSFLPNLANDGDVSTRWTSPNSVLPGSPPVVLLDVGMVTPMTEIIIDWGSQHGVKYDIDISNDNLAWTNTAHYDDPSQINIPDQPHIIHTFSDLVLVGRYIRITIYDAACCGGTYRDAVAINELIVNGPKIVCPGNKCMWTEGKLWTRVYACNDTSNGLDLPFNTVTSFANSATQILITNSDAFRVISKPNAFPIQNLRQGITITGAGTVTTDMVATAWDVEPVALQTQVFEHMWTTCGPTMPIDQNFYHACNNANGLHLIEYINWCYWDLGAGYAGPIEAYIDTVVNPIIL